MIDIEQKIDKLIKKLQEILIKNTSDLDEKDRSELYSTFNGLRYFAINMTEAKKYMNDIADIAGGQYLSNEKCIHIVNPKDIDMDFVRILMHEMIHAITDAPGTDPQRKRGYSLVRLYQRGYNNYTFFNLALDEAATEYYATKFIGYSEITSYPFIVNIYSYLSDVCGYDKLRKAFFKKDVPEFVEILADIFHLKDSRLIDKLMSQMDVMRNIALKTKEYDYNTFMMYCECCYTLMQMTFNKIRVERPELSDKEVLQSIDVEKMIRFIPNNKILESCVRSYAKSLLDYLSDSSKVIEQNKMHNNAYEAYTSDVYVIEQLLNANKLDNFSKDLLKANLDLFLLRFDSIERIVAKDNMLNLDYMLDAILNNIKNEKGKLDLSKLSEAGKNNVMTYLMLGKFSDNFRPTDLFDKKDLIDFVNRGRNNCLALLKYNDAVKFVIENKSSIAQYIKDNPGAYHNFSKKYLEMCGEEPMLAR